MNGSTASHRLTVCGTRSLSEPSISRKADSMAGRTGSAILPLHGGRVPGWLADRMSRLGAVMSQAIVHHYGRDELLRRLAHPFWFQSFGAVMGMDWHSSGITTSVWRAETWPRSLGERAWNSRVRWSREIFTT